MSYFSVAVLVTCFNRKDKTLECLSRLFSQIIPETVSIAVHLVDDASTDDTANAVRKSFPEVNVIPGSGSLFWNGGMRLAYKVASEKDPDFYLWLNDDTYLYEDALDRLVSEFLLLKQKGYDKSILVGSTQDASTGSLTYGGVRRHSWWYPLKFICIEPDDSSKLCDTMHGNCVLVSRKAAELVGNLDPSFVHHLTDFDYGLRARKEGCSIWLIPGFVGTCSFHEPNWREVGLSLREKFKQINHPKGLPFSEWRIYAQRHGGPLWPVYWLSPYLRLVVTSIF